MRTVTGLLGSVLVLLLVAATGAAPLQRGEIREKGDAWVEETDQVYDVATGGTLSLRANGGGISVASWDKEGVRLRIAKKAEVYTEAEARAVLEACTVEVERRDDDLAVDIHEPRRGAGSLSLDIEVTVPRPYNVDVETRGGGINVDDMEGNVTADTDGGGIDVGEIENGSVSARTGGGGINVERVSGDLVAKTGGGGIGIGKVGGHLKANTGGGGITVESAGQAAVIETGGGGITIGDVRGELEAHTGGGAISVRSGGQTVSAETGGGGITIDGSRGPVSVHTGGGGITVKDARGSIEAETGGGGITAELAIDDPDVDTHVDLASNGGSLTVRLPEGLKATIDAEVRLEKPTRQYEIQSDFPLTIEENQGRGRRLSAKGTINGGGDLIRLRTTNGDISIEKR